MFITEKRKNDVKILELNGRIEGSADNFKAEIDDMIQRQTKILVDCLGLNFINSSGLRVFLTTLKNVTANNGKIVICNLQKNVAEVFRISGFINLFEVYDTQDEAMNHL